MKTSPALKSFARRSSLAFAIILICSRKTMAESFENMKTNLGHVVDIKQIVKSSGKERDMLLSKAAAGRRELEEDLNNMLANADSKTAKQSAAYLLGLYRMEGGVQTLSLFITLRKEPELQDRESLIGEYPAVEALIRIGNPSVPAMLRNIEETGDENVRRLSAKVIFYAEGAEIAPTVLRNRIAQQANQRKRGNLESCLKHFGSKSFIDP